MQRNDNFKIFNPNNSMYNEIVYCLEKKGIVYHLMIAMDMKLLECIAGI